MLRFSNGVVKKPPGKGINSLFSINKALEVSVSSAQSFSLLRQREQPEGRNWERKVQYE
jgi:hypothetical protein